MGYDRSMKHAVIVGLVCILCSCATGGGPSGPPAGTDWKALESSAVNTEPLQLVPEIEPTSLRLSLFYLQTYSLGNVSGIQMGGYPLTRPLGVDLGNGLAIDSGGNVFLDLLKLLQIDTSAPFRIERSLGGRATLIRDAGGITLRSPKVRGTVVESGKAFSLKDLNGKEAISIALSEGTYQYHSTLTMDPPSQMEVSDDSLTVTGPLAHTLRIKRDGESVLFNPAADPDFPQYVITKQGDCYTVQYKSLNALLTFKIYFTGSAVYVLQNGMVALSVIDTGSSIFVNGREAVTYSKG
jgi:hypothetical protein